MGFQRFFSKLFSPFLGLLAFLRGNCCNEESYHCGAQSYFIWSFPVYFHTFPFSQCTKRSFAMKVFHTFVGNNKVCGNYVFWVTLCCLQGSRLWLRDQGGRVEGREQSGLLRQPGGQSSCDCQRKEVSSGQDPHWSGLPHVSVRNMSAQTANHFFFDLSLLLKKGDYGTEHDQSSPGLPVGSEGAGACCLVLWLALRGPHWRIHVFCPCSRQKGLLLFFFIKKCGGSATKVASSSLPVHLCARTGLPAPAGQPGRWIQGVQRLAEGRARRGQAVRR